jgi:hypothetical protein
MEILTSIHAITLCQVRPDYDRENVEVSPLLNLLALHKSSKVVGSGQLSSRKRHRAARWQSLGRS